MLEIKSYCADTLYRQKLYRVNMTDYKKYLDDLGLSNRLDPTLLSLFPMAILNQVFDYYQSYLWFYINHPDLGYKSPITYFRLTRNLPTIYDIIQKETA